MSDNMSVDIIPHQSRGAVFYVVVREPGEDPHRRGYGCEIAKHEAFTSADSAWWRDKGNPHMAEYEAERWAKARAIEMASAAFAAAPNKQEAADTEAQWRESQA